ncbi:MAG: ATP-binding cassette domain-containing protein, partial [Anaerolineae bacterium]|nr:ATP-binding cassette domain-containing protein [Anaerolineae bacterium]
MRSGMKSAFAKEIKVDTTVPTSPKLLSVKNLSKYFGSVAALGGVDFDLGPGEVLGVVGQRGSGKSTLFQVLSGVYPPTNGEILLEDRRLALRSASHAQRWGIETVYQNPQLAGNFNVLNNIFLGRELWSSNRFRIRPDEKHMAQIAHELLDSFQMARELMFEQPANLSNEQTQVVALCRALCRSSRLLLLDDALAALTFERQQKLLVHIKQIASQNVGVILSSDDLKHIFAVTDRILVLYQGRQVAVRTTTETTPREIVELI